MRFEIFPELREALERHIFWFHGVSFIVDEIRDLISLRTIGDHDEWETMDTGEDPSMESHPHDRVERRIEFQRLFDRIGSIVRTTEHESLHIECVVLALVSLSAMHEKYWIISSLDEVVIDLWYFSFIISEKSSSHRYANSSFLWLLLRPLWYREKCYIRNL